MNCTIGGVVNLLRPRKGPPGEPIHQYLLDLDRWWAVHAPLGVYGPSQRWSAVAASMKGAVLFGTGESMAAHRPRLELSSLRRAKA